MLARLRNNEPCACATRSAAHLDEPSAQLNQLRSGHLIRERAVVVLEHQQALLEVVLARLTLRDLETEIRDIRGGVCHLHAYSFDAGAENL